MAAPITTATTALPRAGCPGTRRMPMTASTPTRSAASASAPPAIASQMPGMTPTMPKRWPGPAITSASTAASAA